MTIAMGFRCVDGIVMGTDSMETDGVTKKNVSKIWTYQVDQEWGVSIASAGEADFADSFTDGLQDTLGNGDFDETALMLRLRSAIGNSRMAYPDSQLSMLIGYFTNTKLPSSRIFRVMDGSPHLGPIRRHESIGIASILTKFLCSYFFQSTMMVEEAIRVGAFCIAAAKENIDGCGGETSFVSHKFGDKSWIVTLGDAVKKIEDELSEKEFSLAMEQFWKAHNPTPLFPANVEITDRHETPMPRIIVSAKLNTKP